ncbi:basic proline-rich protein-like [Zalophus californianus]|uniref:Basic proline-rich protein-like n=1 Tax=Zalophus californianus TaxID=9704 RepID=A0A6J2F1G7_ZALCA|nr:basic proline-rich protein-like [Zalophus californianus]
MALPEACRTGGEGTPPPPRRRHVRLPRPPGERGANNRLLLGRSPRPQEPQTPRPASRPLSPPPAGARLGCGRPDKPPPPTPHAPLPDCGGRGSRGRLTSPGPHWPPGGAAEPAPPLFVNKPARPLRHLRSRTLSASRPATPTQGRSWDGGWGQREARVWGCSVPPLLSQRTPATSSREPTRPGQSRPVGTRGAHTHPGGMNTPEGAVMGGRAASFERTRPPSAARCGACCCGGGYCCSNCSGGCCGCGCRCSRSGCRRVRVVAAAADSGAAAVVVAAAAARRPLACGSRGVSGRPADPRPARRPPRPAPPPPGGSHAPPPRDATAPPARPPAADKSGLAGARRAPLPPRGGFPAVGGGAGPGPARGGKDRGVRTRAARPAGQPDTHADTLTH